MYSFDALRLLIRSLWSILIVYAILTSTSTSVFSQIVFQPTTGSGSSGLTIGTTMISGGGTNCILYDDGALLQCEAAVTRSAASQFTFSKAAIGTTPFDSIILTNSTAAAAGLQQESPAIHWTGQGWKTTATAGSQVVDCREYLLPVQGSANPSAQMNTECSVNGGAYSLQMTLGSLLTSGLGTGSITIGNIRASNIDVYSGGAQAAMYSSVGFALAPARFVGWSGSGDASSCCDTALFRISSGVIGIGKGSTVANGLLNLAGATFLDPTATTGATRVLLSLGAADSATTATLTNAGTTKSGGYQSSDGTAGVTQTCTILSITTFVVKNGLIVSCS